MRVPPAAPWPALPLSWRVNKLPSKFIPGQAPTEATPPRCYLPPNLKTCTGLTGRKHVVSTPMNCHHTRPIFSLSALPNFPNCSKQDILKITWPEQLFSSRHTKAVQSQSRKKINKMRSLYSRAGGEPINLLIGEKHQSNQPLRLL